MAGRLVVDAFVREFQKTRQLCDRSIAQLSDAQLHARLDAEANSVAMLMQHLAGNMRSRWTDFLTTDGEKPNRDRDGEFDNPTALTKEQLLARWEQGWACLFAALDGLTEEDLDRSITIRTKPMLVSAAISRQLQHYGVHTGQIVLLAKHLVGPANWKTLSVARGASKAFNEAMARGEDPDAKHA